MPSQSPVSYSGGQARPGDVLSRLALALPCANAAPLRAEVQTLTFGGTSETSYSPTYPRPDGRTATGLAFALALFPARRVLRRADQQPPRSLHRL